MKKLPDKIWLSEDRTMWLHNPYSTEYTEYIRKDAFIDKVCELLTRMIWEVTYEDLEGDSVQHYDKMEFIEDLKKTMEENKL